MRFEIIDKKKKVTKEKKSLCEINMFLRYF